MVCYYALCRDKNNYLDYIFGMSLEKPIATISSEGRSIFGVRMRQARQMVGLPQDRLGVLIGIDQHSASARMSRYENGIHEPSIATAQKMADALEVPLPFFYCESDLVADIVMASSELTDEDKRAVLATIKERLNEVRQLLSTKPVTQ